MFAQSFSRSRMTGFFFVLLCIIWTALVIWVNVTRTTEQARNQITHLPFGILALPDGTILAQDFAYNRLFLKGISERMVSHPYRLEDQEKMMRQIIPVAGAGMTHGYSPVTLVAGLPLLLMSGYHAFLLYTLFSATGILLLFYFYLLPATESRLQLGAFLGCTVSLCVVGQINLGQSALVTTTLIGALWYLLKTRTASTALTTDFWIAVLFWATCVKPSVAIIPFALLVGERAWRPLLFTLFLLTITWLGVAPYYGGVWTGLWDYQHLLNHYDNSALTPYLVRFPQTEEQKYLTSIEFSLGRMLVLASCFALIALRWTGRLSRSELFQGMVWAFLLFSPYLQPNEYWILILLVVEGSFFQSKSVPIAVGKLALLCALVDLRAGVTFPWSVEIYVKWLLFAWVALEWLGSPRSASYEAVSTEKDNFVSPAQLKPIAPTAAKITDS